MTKNAEIFRATSIRGIYGKNLDESAAEDIGKAFGTFIGSGKIVGVSRDYRTSGESLMKAFVSGITSTGCDVVDLGAITTPMLYFAVVRQKFDAGVSITASHNPAEWNGFKLTDSRGLLYSDENGMKKIKDIFIRQEFEKAPIAGKVSRHDIYPDYKKFVLSKIASGRKLKIILDPGHGAACQTAEDLFRAVGHEVSVINGNPDGRFPSRPSEPTEANIAKLRAEVLSHKADMGMAFDGDSDRIAIIDNLGRYVSSGNIMIPIFSEYYLKKNPRGKIVFDVCCSSFVEENVRRLGGTPIVTKVGQYYIQKELQSGDAVFGGEFSSHMNFMEIFGFDDAIFAGLKMAEIISSGSESMAQMTDRIPRYPASNVLEIPCDDKIKFHVTERIVERLKDEGYRVIDIDGVKAFDKSDGWFLIRASNTLPVIKVNSEAKTEAKMRELFERSKSIVDEEIRKSI